MGQKTNPLGFRLVLSRMWQSNWFANKKDFSKFLLEDVRIREFLGKHRLCNGSSGFHIGRMGDKTVITIKTSRPGLVIGKKGSDIEQIKNQLTKLTGNKNIWVEVEEVKSPDTNAMLVAKGIAAQLERRMMFRKVMKKSIQNAMNGDIMGIKIQCSGRLGGAEIARTEWYKKGKVPLQNMRYNIDYGTSRALTIYGIIGTKVWITKGDGLSTEDLN